MKRSEPLVVVYDGHCALCLAGMARLERMFGEQVRRMDFRAVKPEEIHPELSESRCQARLHVLEGQRIYGGAAALARLMRLHPVYRWLAFAYEVPPLGWLADRVYELVARHRFRLSRWMGRDLPCTDACQVLPQAEPMKKKIR
jgi:predicted DCC family thiol-disulfide oxidoreductase YuxK